MKTLGLMVAISCTLGCEELFPEVACQREHKLADTLPEDYEPHGYYVSACDEAPFIGPRGGLYTCLDDDSAPSQLGVFISAVSDVTDTPVCLWLKAEQAAASSPYPKVGAYSDAPETWNLSEAMVAPGTCAQADFSTAEPFDYVVGSVDAEELFAGWPSFDIRLAMRLHPEGAPQTMFTKPLRINQRVDKNIPAEQIRACPF